jgi:hypothetical protein
LSNRLVQLAAAIFMASMMAFGSMGSAHASLEEGVVLFHGKATVSPGLCLSDGGAALDTEIVEPPCDPAVTTASWTFASGTDVIGGVVPCLGAWVAPTKKIPPAGAGPCSITATGTLSAAPTAAGLGEDEAACGSTVGTGGSGAVTTTSVTGVTQTYSLSTITWLPAPGPLLVVSGTVTKTGGGTGSFVALVLAVPDNTKELGGCILTPATDFQIVGVFTYAFA